jgi:hypothetical protein
METSNNNYYKYGKVKDLTTVKGISLKPSVVPLLLLSSIVLGLLKLYQKTWREEN